MKPEDFVTKWPHLIVFDTEFTTWEGAYERGWSKAEEHREIFQVSAIMVDIPNGKFLSTFFRYVYPRINPLLSPFALELTGVAQHDVDQGVDFREMYADLLAWSRGLPLCSYARTFGPEGEGEVFKENLTLYELEAPYQADRFQNLVPLFAAAGVETEHWSSGELYRCFDLEMPGTLHDATHDAQSLAMSVIALAQESTVLDPPKLW